PKKQEAEGGGRRCPPSPVQQRRSRASPGCVAEQKGAQCFRPKCPLEFPEGKERHQHDEHGDSDHEYSLQFAAADAGNTLIKRLAAKDSDKRFLDHMKANQQHGKNSGLK
ncbi:MAG TPA: hypothetical protein VL996_02630, partial [Methylocella sp.]|nr:hypothetical protein [Methylocella sp.]